MPRNKTYRNQPKTTMAVITLMSSLILVLFLAGAGSGGAAVNNGCESELPGSADDKDQIQFALNMEFAKCENFLFGALGYGIDAIAPALAGGGPPPIGLRKARLNARTRAVMEEFGYQGIGHIRAIINRVGGFPRPLIDQSPEAVGKFMNEAIGFELQPPFNPYSSTLKFLISSYGFPYTVGYVGMIPKLVNATSKSLAAGLLGVDAGREAVIRTILYRNLRKVVVPYNKTVEDFTTGLSELKNRLAKCGVKDEGLKVPKFLGAENRTRSNILSADPNSLSYARSSAELLRYMYGTGNESQPGGVYPRGANGRIARAYLSQP